jgi:broad specificity phosphatase PhoE
VPTVLLIRHGQASFGSGDYDVLSDAGHAQSAAVHAALAPGLEQAPLLVSGALRRQRDTAAPWTADGLELRVDPRWDEYDSEHVLRTYADVAASLDDPGGAGGVDSRGFQQILDPALERWIAAGDDGPGSWAAFRGGAVAALDELAGGLASGRTGIAFTSGGVIAACAAALLGAPDDVFVALNRTAINTGITKVLAGRRGLSLVSYNEHAHLAAGEITFR